jgi:hypothetical protein
MTSYDEEKSSEKEDTPIFDGAIDLVFVNAQGLSQLVRGKYFEYMSTSQHQHYLNSFLINSSERGSENLLKRHIGFANLINHINLLLGELAFSYKTTFKEIIFFLFCQGFIAIFLFV